MTPLDIAAVLAMCLFMGGVSVWMVMLERRTSRLERQQDASARADSRLFDAVNQVRLLVARPQMVASEGGVVADIA